MSKILLGCTNLALETIVLSESSKVNIVCDVVCNGMEILQRLRLNEYDLAILDWQLSDMNSVDLLRLYRAQAGGSPIIVLTPAGSPMLRVRAIECGADDALMKPFLGCELVARIHAQLRRETMKYESVLCGRHIMLEVAGCRITVDEKPVHLLPKEVALLEFFLRNQGQVLSSEYLISRVWSSSSDVTTESMRTYIKRLRQKLDRPGENSIIRTVHGVGYAFDRKAIKVGAGQVAKSAESAPPVVGTQNTPVPIF